MRISDWISDVCSSDLGPLIILAQCLQRFNAAVMVAVQLDVQHLIKAKALSTPVLHQFINTGTSAIPALPRRGCKAAIVRAYNHADVRKPLVRSEEHTSELQSLMRISYAVFCLKKK